MWVKSERDTSRKELMDAIETVLSDISHLESCHAIHGPEHETWIIEKDCNCSIGKLRIAHAKEAFCIEAFQDK